MNIGIDAVRSVLPGGVSRESDARLDAFKALFDSWSQRINLVGASTTGDFWNRHVADSAQLLGLKPAARSWIDLGSGAGFPGMVIAILLSDLPDARVDLIESNRKKAAFLQASRVVCASCARVHADRIERILPDLPTPNVITARALAPLSQLLNMAAPQLEQGAVALFHKGRGYGQEVVQSRAHWDFDLIEHPSLVAADSTILEISHLRRRGGTD